MSAVLLGGVTIGCSEPPEPDLQSRYVNYFNNSGEELCPGTARHIDDKLEHMFEFLDEPLPDQRFVHYVWGDVLTTGRAGLRANVVRAQSGSSVHDHELAHVAHLQAWPRAPRFLYEGLATLLEDFGPLPSWHSDRRPVGAELDEVLHNDTLDYYFAWIVVSQLLLEQGVTGLREFWLALEYDASLEEVRETYTRLFGGSLDDLMTPFPAEFFEEYDEERTACRIRLCTGPRLDWSEDETIRGSAPDGCQDEEAVSSSLTIGVSYPWRDYHVVSESEPVSTSNTDEGVVVAIESCGVLDCDGRRTVVEEGYADPPQEPWMRENHWRVRVMTNPEIVPPGSAPQFELVPRF